MRIFLAKKKKRIVDHPYHIHVFTSLSYMVRACPVVTTVVINNTSMVTMVSLTKFCS